MRTVQSLACLDEADHTVGFLLQLSNFCKEWQFHLPKLLHDVQVSTGQPARRPSSSGAVSHPLFLFEGKPVLPVSDLHISAAQQEDASSLSSGQFY